MVSNHLQTSARGTTYVLIVVTVVVFVDQCVSVFQEQYRGLELILKKCLGLLKALARGNDFVQLRMFERLDILLKIQAVESDVAVALKEVRRFHLLASYEQNTKDYTCHSARPVGIAEYRSVIMWKKETELNHAPGKTLSGETSR